MKTTSKKQSPAFSRLYRKATARADEISFQVVAGQTDLWITTRPCPAVDLPALALEQVTRLRAQLQGHILLHPGFAESLVPVAVDKNAPEVVRRMAYAAELFQVGPMAAVAGTLAAMTAEALLPWSADVIVENGGDVMLYSTRTRVIGLLSEPGAGIHLGIEIPAEDFPLAVCSSSSRFGHSLSFGQGDLTVVRAKDASIADAAVTAFANKLHTAADAGTVAEQAAAFAPQGIEGIVTLCQGSIGIWGAIHLVPLDI